MTNGAPKATTAGLVVFAAFGAASIGGLSLLIGVVGSIIVFPGANQGPLLGIFVTGPVGSILGALLGVWLWERRAGAPGATRAALAVAIVWIAALLYTLFTMNNLAPAAAVLGVAVQGVIAGSIAHRCWARANPTAETRPAPAWLPVFLFVIVAVLLSTVFPPVTKPWWGDAPDAGSGPLPFVAFILSPGFDSRVHVPRYAIDTQVLVLEWLAVAIAGLAWGAFVARTARSRAT